MKGLMTKCAATLPLILCLPGLAAADQTQRCKTDILRGQYIFTGSGFTRGPSAGPADPWFPKAIIELLTFNGDGTLTTPGVTLANPFGNTGNILQLPAGAPGSYTINDDCTGTLQFFDANNVAYKIYVDPPRGENIWMIQVNPVNNVLQGSGKRLG